MSVSSSSTPASAFPSSPSSVPHATLTYDQSRSPLSLLALANLITQSPISERAQLLNVKTHSLATAGGTQQPTITFTKTKEVLIGAPLVFRYLARLLALPLPPSTLPSPVLSTHTATLYGSDPVTSTQIDYFLSLSPLLSNKDTLLTYTDLLASHLKTRTYLVSHNVTIADFACYDALLSNPRWAVFVKAQLSSSPSLHRWYDHITSLPLLSSTLIAKQAQEKQKEDARYSHAQQGSFDVDLGDTSGPVVTRFPPEPSGYLHIGHAKAALLNDTIARKFNGNLILRFDDTNPKKEKDEYVQSIFRDLTTLGVKWDRLTNTSDYFDLLQQYASKLIEQGKAYVDFTPQEEMRKQRMEGEESKCRSHSIEENLRLWSDMLLANEKGLKCCLRAKIDMQCKNKAMRDPVIYRCNLTPHHLTGTKYKAYPTYDFACFGEDDTRVLTDQGFMFLSEIEQFMAAMNAPPLLFACYDKTTSCLVYRPGHLVLPSNSSKSLVEITQPHERSRWSNTADAYGRGARVDGERTNQLSIRVTPNHQMFLTLGNKLVGHPKVNWSPWRNPKSVTISASSLLSDCSCAAGVDCEHRRKAARFLGVATGGVLHEEIDGRPLPFAQLGLQTSIQINAFLEIYGFWLGGGSILFQAEGHSEFHKLSFHQFKSNNLAWLCGKLCDAGLVEGSDWTLGDGLTVSKAGNLLIRRPSMVKLFCDEYGSTYKKSTNHISSAERFFWWIKKRLGIAQLRLIIDGLRRADGDCLGGSNTLYTSSDSFRDELMMILLHAGYSTGFVLKHGIGDIKGYHHNSSGGITNVADRNAAVTNNPNCAEEFIPLQATANIWAVRYTEPNNTLGKIAAFPSIQLQESVRVVPYDKRVWCVNVEHQDHLIVAQRAYAENGVVTKASRPIIIGNCPIIDSIEGVTHALRTNEYHDRNDQYYWMCNALSLRTPIIRDYSRLNFVYTTLSKRKLTWFVDEGYVQGWDDPRMPTIQGILRRGMTVEALRDFMNSQGFSIGVNLMEWDKIWTINKKIIDPIAPRFTAITKENIVELTLDGVSAGSEAITVDLHPKNKSVGSKVITRSNTLLIEQEDAKSFALKEEITLMNYGNAIINNIEYANNDSNNYITKVNATFNPQGNPKATDKKITWLDGHPNNINDLITLIFVELDTLINVAKVEEDMNFNAIINKKTWYETIYLIEPAVKIQKKGTILQLNRRGYVIIDQIKKDGSVVVILIPDGKTKNISVLGSKVDKAKIFKAAAGHKEEKEEKEEKKV